MDIHVQQVDHKRKVDTNRFVSEIHQIWKDLMLLDSLQCSSTVKKHSKKEGKFLQGVISANILFQIPL